MDSKKEHISKKVPRKVPRKVVFVPMTLRYTKPKLYMPKNGGYWYVWFRFRDNQGNYKKYTFKNSLNRIDNLKEKKIYGEELAAALHELLKEGWDPSTNMIPIEEVEVSKQPEVSILTAFKNAFELKKVHYAESTVQDFDSRLSDFYNWLTKKKLDQAPVSELSKKTITEFLNYKAKDTSAKNVNNYRAAISAMISKMVDDDLVERNFVLDIRKLKEKVTKNKPFSPELAKEISEYLEKTDPYLLKFMQFVAYAFLRNREVTRLQVKSIDLTNKIIKIPTKTSTLETVLIIPKLADIIKSMEIEKFDSNDFLFTPQLIPGPYDAQEKNKVGFFAKRFLKVKKAFKLDTDYTVYSLRHTFAINLYQGFIKEGTTEKEAILKMLPITRHKNESGLRNYLRDIGAILPEDYSDKLSIDF